MSSLSLKCSPPMPFQVNGDIPPRLKKSAHEIILEFIRSRPPLNPVSSTHVGSNLSEDRFSIVKINP